MSSSRPEQEVVQHFTHIHPLTLVTVGDFICDGCNMQESGKTYCCAKCDYHLDEFCAKCPPTLLSVMHPKHELQLVLKGPEHACDICNESVGGLCYRCEACDFDVHPLCTLQPHDEVPRHTKRRRMLRVLKFITFDVVLNII